MKESPFHTLATAYVANSYQSYEEKSAVINPAVNEHAALNAVADMLKDAARFLQAHSESSTTTCGNADAFRARSKQYRSNLAALAAIRGKKQAMNKNKVRKHERKIH
jgi:hypothetical protein